MPYQLIVRFYDDISAERANNFAQDFREYRAIWNVEVQEVTAEQRLEEERTICQKCAYGTYSEYPYGSCPCCNGGKNYWNCPNCSVSNKP